MSGRTVVIVNPTSRLGETGRRVAELEKLLRQYVPGYELVRTSAKDDATRIAREAAQGGARRIVIAGGDGTVSEALNGLLTSDGARDVELGLLPLGTGRDFIRLLGLGTDLEEAVRRIERGYRRKVDAARVSFRSEDGAQKSRVFLNIASFGLTGESALWLEQRGKQGKRGKLSYVTSGLVGLTRYHAPRVRVRVDGEEIFAGRLSLAAVANGQYFAGGMKVAPEAKVDDGLFDVVVVPKLPVTRSLMELPRLMRGEHVTTEGVVTRRGRMVEAEAERDVWIEADGEPIGLLPARFELLAGAVTLCGMP